uniref:Uncharacterized protein n=1 Tax=Ixodes ricinus TaxID=34613 RepID=A0A6B0UCG1_IXORI
MENGNLVVLLALVTKGDGGIPRCLLVVLQNEVDGHLARILAGRAGGRGTFGKRGQPPRSESTPDVRHPCATRRSFEVHAALGAECTAAKRLLVGVQLGTDG